VVDCCMAAFLICHLPQCFINILLPPTTIRSSPAKRGAHSINPLVIDLPYPGSFGLPQRLSSDYLRASAAAGAAGACEPGGGVLFSTLPHGSLKAFSIGRATGRSASGWRRPLKIFARPRPLWLTGTWKPSCEGKISEIVGRPKRQNELFCSLLLLCVTRPLTRTTSRPAFPTSHFTIRSVRSDT